MQLSEYACPICKAQTGEDRQIAAGGGQIICTFNAAHNWRDHMEFLNLNPQMVFKVTPEKTVQENHVPYTVNLPAAIKQAVEAKLGDKAAPTVASLLMQLLEGEVLIIGQEDLSRMTVYLGSKPGSSAELTGLIYALSQQREDLKNERDNAAADLQAYQGMAPGRVVINLGTQFEAAKVKARDANLPVPLWAEQSLKGGLENGWF